MRIGGVYRLKDDAINALLAVEDVDSTLIAIDVTRILWNEHLPMVRITFLRVDGRTCDFYRLTAEDFDRDYAEVG